MHNRTQTVLYHIISHNSLTCELCYASHLVKFFIFVVNLVPMRLERHNWQSMVMCFWRLPTTNGPHSVCTFEKCKLSQRDTDTYYVRGLAICKCVSVWLHECECEQHGTCVRYAHILCGTVRNAHTRMRTDNVQAERTMQIVCVMFEFFCMCMFEFHSCIRVCVCMCVCVTV